MNTQPRQSLFREEVLQARTQDLHGDISLALPLSWNVIGYGLLGILLAAAVFIGSASYARVETVTGEIALSTGIAPVVAHRQGTIRAIRVKNGDHVTEGAVLGLVASDEALVGGSTTGTDTLSAVGHQEASLGEQAAQARAAGAAAIARLEEQVAGLRLEIESLTRQIETQETLISSARKQLESVRGLAGRGFISGRDLVQREETVLTRVQQLDQLEQTRRAKQAEMRGARSAIAEARAQSGIQAATLASSRAELSQRRVQAQAGSGIAVIAPISGTVTALTAQPGAPVSDEQPLMTLIPDNADAIAQLRVPPDAIGFIEKGQEVRLAVDAFPFERFGVLRGEIVDVSAAATPSKDKAGTVVPVYVATVKLTQSAVRAFGREHRLLPGMSLTGRVVTRRQSLFEWLFEPLLAVANR